MISNTKTVELFQNISLEDINLIGKSPAVLSRFHQEKLPIPNGFVISIYGFNQYLDLTDLRKYYSKSRQEKDRSDLADAFEASTLPGALQEEIFTAYSKISGFTDAFVTVRGMILDDDSNELSHRTYVNYDIRGEQSLSKSIESLYKEIVLDNLNVIDKFFSGELRIVIIVHKSVQAEASGILYTSDIVTKDNSKLIIESLYGLESGAAMEGIIPDQYIFDKNTNTIKEKHISSQEFMIVRQPGSGTNVQKVAISPAWQKRQKIDDKHILVLSKTGLIVEDELSEPQIVSWCYESGKIWITFVESAIKKEGMNNRNRSLQQKVDEQIEKAERGTDLNVHIPEEIAKHKNVLVDLILKDNPEEHEETKVSNNLSNKKMNPQTTRTVKKEPLLEGAFGAGNEAQGDVSFDPENSNVNNILVLKGDEDISSTLKVAGFIIEDESEILAERLYEYFKVPVVTGVSLARKILKLGEKISIDGGSSYVYELVPSVEESDSTRLGEVEMSFTSIGEDKSARSNFSFPVEENQTLEVQTQFTPSIFNTESAKPDIEVIENDEIEIETPKEMKPDREALNAVINGDAMLYEDQKVRIERRAPDLSFHKKEEVSTASKDISNLLNLVNEEAKEENIAEVVNEKATSAKDEITGMNPNDQFKVWGKSLEKIISASKSVAPTAALEALEHVVDDSKDSIESSREFNFDKEERYISQVVDEVKVPAKKKADEFIPTATKVYAQLIDESLDEDLENFDGIVFTSTYEPDVLYQYLEKTLEKAGDKEVLVVAPPYEEEALEKFFKHIYSIRNKGNRNVSLVLPDYRNKKEISEYKKVLSVVGLRRSSTFEVFANLSRTINVFRIDEISQEVVDGVYVDLFRLKMNMLGVDKLSASTKYVDGMKKLVSYIHENMKVDGRSLVNISGFEDYKKVLEHISNFGFWGIVCEQKLVSEVKKQISRLEKESIGKELEAGSSVKRRRGVK